MKPRRALLALVAVLALALVGTPSNAAAQQGVTPLNDLLSLGEGNGDTPDPAPIQKPPAPPIKATPRANCGPGSKPEPSVQGRVPAGSATNGLWCNVRLVSHYGESGGFKVFEYVDTRGHECAFYDTALLFPLNAFNLSSSSTGVAVLDMSNPAKPVQTATLTEPAMLSPHESLNLNTKRGLLAAVSGNPSAYPGWVSIYDVHNDCRNPVLDASAPLARLGHESGFSLDGKTFYATGTAYKSITAIDVTNPRMPHVVWQGNVQSHGMSLSPDGRRAYLANPDVEKGDMIVLDTSQIQARLPNPHTKMISRMTWDRISIPQNAFLFTEHGHPYVLEFDEYNNSTLDPNGDPDEVGAGRIIDMADETKPRIVSYLRLQIQEPADHKKYGDDPGADGGQNGGPQGYAAHYCNLPTRVDPKLVACSFIASGLRLFDISDVKKPKEVGYYVAPTKSKPENGGNASDFAMSQAAFVPARREVWFTDGTSGFYALRLTNGLGPLLAGVPSNGGSGGAGAVKHKCRRGRVHRFHLRRIRGTRLRRVVAYANGKRVFQRRGRNIRRIAISGLKRTGRLRLRIVAYHSDGTRVVTVRRWKGCKKTKPRTRIVRPSH